MSDKWWVTEIKWGVMSDKKKFQTIPYILYIPNSFFKESIHNLRVLSWHKKQLSNWRNDTSQYYYKCPLVIMLISTTITITIKV